MKMTQMKLDCIYVTCLIGFLLSISYITFGPEGNWYSDSPYRFRGWSALLLYIPAFIPFALYPTIRLVRSLRQSNGRFNFLSTKTSSRLIKFGLFLLILETLAVICDFSDPAKFAMTPFSFLTSIAVFIPTLSIGILSIFVGIFTTGLKAKNEIPRTAKSF